DHLRDLCLAIAGTARRSARTAGDRRHRAVVDRQLLRREARQPGVECARDPQSRGARRPDRCGGLRAVVRGMAVGLASRLSGQCGHAARVRRGDGADPVRVRSRGWGRRRCPFVLASGGWQNANYLAEEIERPERNLPLSLVAGTVSVVLIYVLVNVVYLRALGIEGLAATTTPHSRD